MAPTDIEIAREANLAPITKIASKLQIPEDALELYGNNKAKISNEYITSLQSEPDGKLVLVTAITPTPAGEGKTTMTVGLGDALNRIGRRAGICLREPSLGPCFGMKGGAAGGGYAQVVPMEDINLHFTGDMHAIGVAHNLLSAMVDNHIYWGNKEEIDVRRVQWRRVVDMNDRALRDVVSSLGGVANGFPRQTGFDITVASEIMAIFCLAENLTDLTSRLENIVIGFTSDKRPVRAGQLEAHGAMAVLLKNAIAPNLVQTLENNPAFVHGGPFANIAHGCNSVIATKAMLKMSDIVVTEAGFGADLGAEKFFDIKCRKAGLKPDVAVLVATTRALKMHGGVARADLDAENLDAVKQGLANLDQHDENIAKFGVPRVVGINRFTGDTDAEIKIIVDHCEAKGLPVRICTHWANGGEGAEELAKQVADMLDNTTANFKPLYSSDKPLLEKIETIAKEIYRADGVKVDKKVINQLQDFEDAGFRDFPICIAKTQYSFSSDPSFLGAPSGFTIPIREVRLSAGAEFVVAISGDIMTMPGLPSKPAAQGIFVNDEGQVEGLF
ncbi:MAG: Formate--tetrahydrofolate ligase [Alphaproteobacteria bacterium MarineAlpha3_Bin7]|nr:MAG: Formate--tetrahydrofolate ligase [Alphaproteobacteria bacterium MarineAlpha3_Bin7]|tara:strand:- start:1403 stop:3076 length:1674 start_codon:yes stop_codon:yes gene_type:complete